MAIKFRVPLLLLFALFALAASFPRDGDWRSKGDEVVIVPLERQNPSAPDSREDLDDFEDGPETYGAPAPWSFGFLESMQAMLWQMRNQMQELLRRFPYGSFNSTDGGEVIISQPWDSIPGNTTSTTKVINGHVVTVNETTYKQGSDGNAAFFHVRVVDIKPQQDTKESNDNEEVGLVKESVSSPSSSMRLGRVAEIPSSMFRWFPSQQRRTFLQPPFRRQWEDEDKQEEDKVEEDQDRFAFKRPISRRVYPSQKQDESPEDEEDENSIDDGVDVFRNENENVIDLSSDLLVNKLMSDQQKKGGLVALHPDVEILDIDNGKVVGTSDDSFLQRKTHEPIKTPPVWE